MRIIPIWLVHPFLVFDELRCEHCEVHRRKGCLIGGGLEVCVQRPQHTANASRIYDSLEQVKATLLNFGITEKALDETLRLLPQLGTGERLNFLPVDVPHHDLVAEGSKLGIG
jgi:hypothetical protein